MSAVDGFTPLIGGIPIVTDGQVVGGIGVSGAATANQDEELALAGANALVGGAKVGSREGNQAGSSAFAKGTADKALPDYKCKCDIH